MGINRQKNSYKKSGGLYRADNIPRYQHLISFQVKGKTKEEVSVTLLKPKNKTPCTAFTQYRGFSFSLVSAICVFTDYRETLISYH